MTSEPQEPTDDLTPLGDVMLGPQARDALAFVKQMFGENRATAVNRALVVYAEVMTSQAMGRQWANYRPEDAYRTPIGMWVRRYEEADFDPKNIPTARDNDWLI